MFTEAEEREDFPMRMSFSDPALFHNNGCIQTKKYDKLVYYVEHPVR
jgi:hypothetical protein